MCSLLSTTGSSPVTSITTSTPSVRATIRSPSVLTMSGSSTPATWTLVPEKPPSPAGAAKAADTSSNAMSRPDRAPHHGPYQGLSSP